MIIPQQLSNLILPDKNGFYGQYGGQFVPEILRPNLMELSQAFDQILHDPVFWDSYISELQAYSGRPTPVTYLGNLSQHLGGAQIYLKREDLGHTGAHKINNVIGQGLLMRRLGKKRVIAETGAGQHGLATATMAARFQLEAVIYMGAEDIARQRPNVFWMERMGARVVPVKEGSQTLKDAINAALRDWVSNLEDTHYLLGTACGPHPFPALVTYLQRIIGVEAHGQIVQKAGCLPDRVFACVGGGSNALGIFQGFYQMKGVELVGVEAGGTGNTLGMHASRIASKQGSAGITQGYKTQFLQNEEGQLTDTHSVAAGLDYVGISPVLADWADKKQIRMESVLDEEVIEALQLLVQYEGIIPALESSHALAQGFKEAKHLKKTNTVLINLSGRGDKDIFGIAQVFDDKNWKRYLQLLAEK